MKTLKLLAGAGLAALLMSPAQAQTFDLTFPGTVKSKKPGKPLVVYSQGYKLYGYKPVFGPPGVYTFYPEPGQIGDPYAVYFVDEYRGRDPDPNVRMQLRTDFQKDY